MVCELTIKVNVEVPCRRNSVTVYAQWILIYIWFSFTSFSWVLNHIWLTFLFLKRLCSLSNNIEVKSLTFHTLSNFKKWFWIVFAWWLRLLFNLDCVTAFFLKIIGNFELGLYILSRSEHGRSQFEQLSRID